MSAVMKWADAWNEIIREVLFKDDRLKELMLLPDNINILTFIKDYFIKSGYTNITVTDEKVRIVYSDTMSEETDAPNVKRNIISFDIYVKNEHVYNADADRLRRRSDLIADRLVDLLTSKRYINNHYRFWIAEGPQDLGTRTVGYSRINVSFYYMKVL